MKGYEQTVLLSGETSLTIASFSKYNTLLYIDTNHLETEGLEMQEKKNLFTKD